MWQWQLLCSIKGNCVSLERGGSHPSWGCAKMSISVEGHFVTLDNLMRSDNLWGKMMMNLEAVGSCQKHIFNDFDWMSFKWIIQNWEGKTLRKHLGKEDFLKFKLCKNQSSRRSRLVLAGSFRVEEGAGLSAAIHPPSRLLLSCSSLSTKDQTKSNKR